MTRTARWMTILWPSFAMAGVLEGLVFSLVDPTELHWLGHGPVQASAQAVYTLAFLAFWALMAISGALTALLWVDLDVIEAETPRTD